MGWFLPLAVRRAAFFSALCPERRAQPRLPADVSSWGSESLESRCLTASGAAAAAGQGPPPLAPGPLQGALTRLQGGSEEKGGGGISSRRRQAPGRRAGGGGRGEGGGGGWEECRGGGGGGD